MTAAPNVVSALFELQGKPKAKREKKPAFVTRVGSATVKAYGRPPGPYTMAWYDSAGGKRLRAKRSSLAEAKTFAQEKATNLANGDNSKATLGPQDQASYLRSLELIQPTGQPLEIACANYAQGMQLLGTAAVAPESANVPKVTLVEAIQFYLDNRPVGFTSKTTAQVVDELIEVREKDAEGRRWTRSLKTHLTPFGKHFGCPLHLLRSGVINTWLRSLPGGKRTRKNYRGAISVLVSFAKECGYLSKNWDELDRVPVPEVKQSEIKVLTPEQMTALLQAAPKSLVPMLALTAFGGVRHEEVKGAKQPLDWHDIRLDEGILYIGPNVAKKGEDREIVMQPNLIAWLTPHVRPNGPVCDLSNTSNAICRAKQRAGIPTGKNETRNALRKSFISYRKAVSKDIALVADEAGTSVAKIKTNYRKSVPETEGQRWFNIMPPDTDTVIQLQFAMRL